MTSRLPYPDRFAAGHELASCLAERLGGGDLLVLALPRGGVPVGYAVARALHAELDVLVVRKLGLPEQPELAMGAITSGGIAIRNESVISSARVPEAVFAEVARREGRELERRETLYRGRKDRPRIEGRTVVLVDDGLATGSSMLAAVQAVRESSPARVIVAVPVAPADTVARLRREADEVVCPACPPYFLGIGQFYEDFSQLSDEEVQNWLADAGKARTTDPNTTS